MAIYVYPLKDNTAHPTKIDFLLEAIVVTKVTYLQNVIIAAMGQQTLGLEDTRASSLALLNFLSYKLRLAQYCRA